MTLYPRLTDLTVFFFSFYLVSFLTRTITTSFVICRLRTHTHTQADEFFFVDSLGRIRSRYPSRSYAIKESLRCMSEHSPE